MAHCAPEVADIFRTHGPDWRKAQRGHLSLGQLKVMSAIAAGSEWVNASLSQGQLSQPASEMCLA